MSAFASSDNIRNPAGPYPALKCDTFDSRLIERKYADIGLNVERFFRGTPVVDLYECQVTGLRFYWPQTCLGDAQFYDDLQDRTGYYPATKWEFDQVLPLLRPHHQLLEIGCGAGAFLERFTSRCAPSHAPTGLDLSPLAVEKARRRGLNVFLETVENHAQRMSEVYHVLCAFQVLEHVPDVDAFFKACLKCVQPGGHLIFGVPNCRPYIYHRDRTHTLNLPPHHASLWNARAAARMAQAQQVKMQACISEPLEDFAHFATILAQHYMRSAELGKLLQRATFHLPGWMRRFLSTRLPGHSFLFIYQKPPSRHQPNSPV